MSHPRQALQQSKRLQKFDFDPQSYTIRRNLMIVSSLSLASVFVSPPPGEQYQVNVGIVKGVVDNPALLYIFLAVACIYYMAWFYIHCQKLVINNYNNIHSSFSRDLVNLEAVSSFRGLMSSHGKAYQQAPIPNFKSTTIINDIHNSEGELNAHAIRRYPQLTEIINAAENFSSEDIHDGIKVTHSYVMAPIDIEYLKTHVDQYWRNWREEWFTAVLPLLFSGVGLIAVGWRIYTLLWGLPTP